MPRAAVVIPIYSAQLSADDRLSLEYLRKHAGKHDRIVIAPGELVLTMLDDFKIVRFPASCFRSVYDYNRLMLSRRFYRQFQQYEYILLYQLDALVFRDELGAWCERGYDYIGAPVFDQQTNEWIALNGGFSLRRTSACLKALSYIPRNGVLEAARTMPFLESNFVLRMLKSLLLYLHHLRILNAIPLLVLHAGYHEDMFWSRFARNFNPDFRPAPFEVALEFALEMNPAHWFEKLGGKLPFGCHAWRRWDYEFWRRTLGLSS